MKILTSSSKKLQEQKLKQKKKDDEFSFKIEETVATPEMIKHLVGDNSPDEEEETVASPAPVAPVVALPEKVQNSKENTMKETPKIQ